MLPVAIGVGVLIGVSLGALGGGGSILTVPALVYLVGMDTRAATTGSLIIVGVTAAAGMLAHHRHRRVLVLQGLAFGLIGIAGAVTGTRLSLAVPPRRAAHRIRRPDARCRDHDAHQTAGPCVGRHR